MISLSGKSESSVSNSASNDAQYKTRFCPWTKSKTSGSYQQVPSRASDSLSHGRISNDYALNPLHWVYIFKDRKVLRVFGI
jgi:hypothetical protein